MKKKDKMKKKKRYELRRCRRRRRTREEKKDHIQLRVVMNVRRNNRMKWRMMRTALARYKDCYLLSINNVQE